MDHKRIASSIFFVVSFFLTPLALAEDIVLQSSSGEFSVTLSSSTSMAGFTIDETEQSTPLVYTIQNNSGGSQEYMYTLRDNENQNSANYLNASTGMINDGATATITADLVSIIPASDAPSAMSRRIELILNVFVINDTSEELFVDRNDNNVFDAGDDTGLIFEWINYGTHDETIGFSIGTNTFSGFGGLLCADDNQVNTSAEDQENVNFTVILTADQSQLLYGYRIARIADLDADIPDDIPAAAVTPVSADTGERLIDNSDFFGDNLVDGIIVPDNTQNRGAFTETIDVSTFPDGLLRLEVFRLGPDRMRLTSSDPDTPHSFFATVVKSTSPQICPNSNVNAVTNQLNNVVSNGVDEIDVEFRFSEEVNLHINPDSTSLLNSVLVSGGSLVSITNNGGTETITRDAVNVVSFTNPTRSITVRVSPTQVGEPLDERIRIQLIADQITDTLTDAQVEFNMTAAPEDVFAEQGIQGATDNIASTVEIPIEVPVDVNTGSLSLFSMLAMLVLLFKKRLVVLVLFLLAGGQALAVDEDSYWADSKWYGAVAVGQSDIEAPTTNNSVQFSDDLTDTGFQFMGGYQYSKHIGFEVTASVYGEVEFQPRDALRYTGLGAYVVLTETFFDDLIYASVRAGGHRLSVKTEGFLNPRGDMNTGAYGASVGINLFEDWDLAVSYDKPADAVDFISLRLQHKLRLGW